MCRGGGGSNLSHKKKGWERVNTARCHQEKKVGVEGVVPKCKGPEDNQHTVPRKRMKMGRLLYWQGGKKGTRTKPHFET